MIKKSRFLTVFLLVVFGLMFMVLMTGTIVAQERPFAGVEINVGLLARGISNALKPYLAEFEAETGIKVNLEQHAYDSFRDKMMLEFAAGSGYFDIVYLSPGFMGELIEYDYLLPLNDLMDKYNLDKDDFLPAGIEINRYGDGLEIWGYPYLADTSILLYRKDLFEDSGERAAFKKRYGYELPVPQITDPLTTDEFLDLAEFFTRDTNDDGLIDFYGFGYPQIGVAYGNLHIMPWIWTFGAEYYDSDYNATLNDPRALEAMRWAKKLQKFQPPGVLAWEYGDHLPRLYEGDLAMTAGWFHIGLDANDPSKSKVAGKIGYAAMPRGPTYGSKTGKAVLGGGGLAITSHSRNPEAAFAWLNWMFSDTERALDWYLNGGGATRKAIYESPKVHEKYPWAKEFFPVANYSLGYVAKQRPTLPVAFSIFEVMSGAWHNVALDRVTPEQALEDANEKIDELLAQYR